MTGAFSIDRAVEEINALTGEWGGLGAYCERLGIDVDETLDGLRNAAGAYALNMASELGATLQPSDEAYEKWIDMTAHLILWGIALGRGSLVGGTARA